MLTPLESGKKLRAQVYAFEYDQHTKKTGLGPEGVVARRVYPLPVVEIEWKEPEEAGIDGLRHCSLFVHSDAHRPFSLIMHPLLGSEDQLMGLGANEKIGFEKDEFMVTLGTPVPVLNDMYNLVYQVDPNEPNIAVLNRIISLGRNFGKAVLNMEEVVQELNAQGYLFPHAVKWVETLKAFLSGERRKGPSGHKERVNEKTIEEMPLIPANSEYISADNEYL